MMAQNFLLLSLDSYEAANTPRIKQIIVVRVKRFK
jgi:hypothetical protein